VSGTAGVGKTTLAVHWAHQVRDRFPDGQLYIDLSGYAHGPPLRPEQALSQFLRALGIRPEHVPVALAEAAALYRSVLADKRVLVVLDNASSADHVRPLLPANPDCLVMITSRNRLDGLVAVDGARRVALDVLPLQDAVALLATILGQDRVNAESQAAAEFAQICARLPLALRIAASHLAGYPGRRIADHVTALRHSDLFAALQVDGDEQAAVHAAFNLSYGALKPEGQFVFRQLGLAPSADVDVAAVAALIDQPQDQAGRLLAQLHATHLIEERSLGRFTCHDLLRRYAKERGEDEDSEQERAAAFDRLIRFYLRTTNAAAERLYPQLLRLTPSPDPASGVFAGSAEALAWLDCERPNLVAAVQAAHARGRSDLAWLLADALRGYFNLRRHMSCWFAVARTAVAAAGHHPMPQASARMSLGRAYQCVARYPEAVEQYTAALELCRQVGWDRGAAAALNNLGIIDQQRGQWDRAVQRYAESLALNIQAGERHEQTNALLNLAGIDMIRGHLDLAADRCQQALTIAVEAYIRPVKDALWTTSASQRTCTDNSTTPSTTAPDHWPSMRTSVRAATMARFTRTSPTSSTTAAAMPKRWATRTRLWPYPLIAVICTPRPTPVTQ
jgi:tetratricopeptide (TPR) repeat protein